MGGAERFEVVLAHAEGEIGRVVTGGAPSIPGATMLAKLRHLNEVDDGLRRKLVREPRGGANMSTNLLLEPTDPAAAAAYLVLQPDKAHAMSGSNSICVVTALLETGRLAMVEPTTRVVLETPAGLVAATASCARGKCERVALRMPPAFVHELDVELVVEGFGKLKLDVAFGGCFYGLLDPAQAGLALESAAAASLVDLGMRALAAANATLEISHPELAGIEGLSYVMLAGQDAAGALLHATVMPPGRIDRSPCGTGSAARLAVMRARGELEVGASLTARSLIGSSFGLRLLETVEVAGKEAVVVEVAGRGWLFGAGTLEIDPTDPWPEGYALGERNN